jgi:ubiquinone/menaquinone biosynthesis C-methylase UbiE
MAKFVVNYCEFPAFVRRPMWRIWHNMLNHFDNDSSVQFMNYGYADLNGEETLKLKKKDEKNRYCIQLYNHVVKEVDLKDKKVLEVGSGRGGGADFISRYYKPLKYIGVDISSRVINFCKQYYFAPGLSFTLGKAEKIPFKESSFDAVVNVESARCYSNIKVFFKEVYRVLSKEGHFLFADMIEKNETEVMRQNLKECGFIIQQEKEITPNVSKGLELDTRRRENLIIKKVPGLLKNAFLEFAGTKGTKRYNSFNNGKFEYRSFVLTKI